jgi:hypothetical protein
MLPKGLDRRTTVFLTFALLFVISIKVAPAQVFDLDKDRMGIVELDGLWRFHTGDDPRWSDPNFDDSSWPLLHSNQPWAAQGYKGYSGMAWYRFKLVVPQDHKPLTLFVPKIATSYELFANGKPIATVGGMPPHPKDVYSVPHAHSISPSAIGTGKTIAIAIRVWHAPNLAKYYGGGPSVAPFVGEADRVEDEKEYWQLYLFWQRTSGNIQLLINLLAGVASMILFWSRRTETEYFWFGASELFRAANIIRGDYWAFHDAWAVPMLFIADLLILANLLCFLLFLIALLKGRRDSLFWAAITVVATRFIFAFPIVMGWIPVSLAWGGWALIYLPVYSCMLVILIRGARRGIPDARLMLAPVALTLIAYSFDSVLSGIATLGIPGLAFPDLAWWFRDLLDWPFPVSVLDVTNLLMQLSILAILLMRFVRTRRDEQRMASELDAARTVQQVLIPEEIPAIPGLALDCVYKPAGEVGGDFFQILPTSSNGALIVIGDVSGKGMPAAMAVSLLVGTVRTLAHYTQSPAEILSAMNQRMLGRSKNGFTTCLALRIDEDGTATIANAGHLAPYQDSNELSVESGLPLGLAAESVYTESTFHIDPGGEITLLTDGVVEARAKNGELYGFDRTASIAILSAQHIAATAQAFGQEDDITVLKIRRQPILEPVTS